MRVVFDTNVLISGTLWQGIPHQCIRAAETGLADAVCAAEILTEFRRILIVKFAVARDRAEVMTTRIRASASVVTLQGRHGWVLADPDDDKFVEAALVGKADAIVSGDHDLRDLGTVAGIPVWTPRQFLEHLAAP